MSNRIGPCKRRDFTRKLRALGFQGPIAGSRHEFMVYGQYRLHIPSNEEYSAEQTKDMIKEVQKIISSTINARRWNSLN